MAVENITYPSGGFGIMPMDSFNKYRSFINQRQATTGIPASTADQKAFWEGTMDAVVKNTATRAAQNLENKRIQSSIDYQNAMLGLEKDKNKQAMYSGLFQIPAAMLMYNTLGVGRQPGEKSWLSQGGNWLSDLWGSKKKIPETVMDRWEYGGIPSYFNEDPGLSYESGNIEEGYPGAFNAGDSGYMGGPDYFDTDFDLGFPYETDFSDYTGSSDYAIPAFSDASNFTLGGQYGSMGTDTFSGGFNFSELEGLSL